MKLSEFDGLSDKEKDAEKRRVTNLKSILQEIVSLTGIEKEILPSTREWLQNDNPATILEKQKCLRCGYSFFPKSETLPKTCPNRKCKSPYWNKPRSKGVKGEMK